MIWDVISFGGRSAEFEAIRTGATVTFDIGKSRHSMAVVVHLRHAQLLDSVALKVELNEHGGLVAHYPTFVAGFNRDEHGRFEFFDAAIGEANVDLAVGHEADVGMHAVVGADDGAQIRGPVETGRVDHALHADVAGAHDVDFQPAAEFAVRVGLDGRQ